MGKASRAKKAQRQERSSESDYVRGGKGRIDDVRGSRIYPVGVANAPANAKIVGAGELGEGPRARLPVKRSKTALAKRQD